MNRTDLKNAVAEQSGLSGADADRAITAVVEVISAALAAGDKVSLPGFGTFQPRERAARTGRNPQSGEEMEIAAATTAGFKAGAELKRRLNG